MRERTGGWSRSALVILCGLFLIARLSRAQEENERGHSIGKVSTQGDLIVLELDAGVLGKTNLFDLAGRTLRFVPDGSRYRVEIQAIQWDADFGRELAGGEVSLHQFAFPFSGQRWKSFRIGATGSIRFGKPVNAGLDPYGHRDEGVVLGRFDGLAEVAGTLNSSAPAICVFLKPRMSGAHHVKELPDRVVVTWDLTEPFGGLLDFTWFKTRNLFQLVLRGDGSIEMSYKELAAKDAIVGIYPVLLGQEKPVAVHFSGLTRQDGPFAAVCEAFHYLAPPRPEDLSWTIIKALGDKFDFLVYYSDFRIDTQEASTPGDGPVGGTVTGIGDTRHDQSKRVLASRGTKGRFQIGFLQPVYVGANEMRQQPPDGAPVGSKHDITFYTRQLTAASPDGKPLPYNYAVGHLGHEVGHRWSAYAFAKVNDEKIPLGTWPHWDRGIQSPVAFPYSQATEASTLGGGVWQDNFDGTYTQLHDGFFVPATGYSHLDLYLMGLLSAAEVPDFFLLKNLVQIRKDGNGHGVFKAERTKVTIQDVIAAEGPRLPDVHHSQREFNTGIVVLVEHGQTPSRELLERANGIRRQWIKYWATATGYRASMTVGTR